MITAQTPPFDESWQQARDDARAKEDVTLAEALSQLEADLNGTIGRESRHTVRVDELHRVSTSVDVVRQALNLDGYDLPPEARPVLSGADIVWEWTTYRTESR